MKIKFYLLTILFLTFLPFAIFANGDITVDPNTNELAVSGYCAEKDVLILIYYGESDNIWGSANLKCEDGKYKYNVKLSNWNIDDGEFEAEVIDGGYKIKASRTETEKLEAKNKRSKIEISAQGGFAFGEKNIKKQSEGLDLANNVSSAISASEGLAEDFIKQDDGSFAMDDVLSVVFGIAKTVGKAIYNFTEIIAKTIKTTALAAAEIFTEKFAIVPDGKIILPEGENQISGRGVIARGELETTILNNQVSGESKIFLTALSVIDSPLIVQEKIEGQGFKVAISKSAAEDVAFDWFLVETYKTEETHLAPANIEETTESEPSAETEYPAIEEEIEPELAETEEVYSEPAIIEETTESESPSEIEDASIEEETISEPETEEIL